jgi:G-patch domain
VFNGSFLLYGVDAAWIPTTLRKKSKATSNVPEQKKKPLSPVDNSIISSSFIIQESVTQLSPASLLDSKKASISDVNEQVKFFFDVSNLVNEYDPFRPNDYLELQNQKRRLREAEIEKEMLNEQLEAAENERKRLRDARQQLLRTQTSFSSRLESDGGNAISSSSSSSSSSSMSSMMHEPSPSISVRGMDNRPAWMTQSISSSVLASRDEQAFPVSPAPEPPGEEPKKLSGMEKAAKMMMKHGWRVGKGIGKAEDGILTPLEVQKRSGLRGVIRQRDLDAKRALIRSSALPDGTPNSSIPSASNVASRIVLLRNFATWDEVQADLTDELERSLKEKALEFGAVDSVVIFALDDARVRIFVVFEGIESAFRAMDEWTSKGIREKPVLVSMFPEDRFQSLDLAPRTDAQGPYFV